LDSGSITNLFGTSDINYKMTEKHRISGLAIASLVFGLLFFIPLVSGILATIFGIKAYFTIRNSDGYILGKNIALSGIILGSIQLLVFLSGVFYIVDQHQQAVVTQSGKIVREAYPGFHAKIPYVEKVYFYPMYKQFKFETAPTKLLLSTKEVVTASIGVQWKVCDPNAVFNSSRRDFNQSSIELVISEFLIHGLRDEAYKYNNIEQLLKPIDQYKTVFEKATSDLNKKFGVCLIKYDEQNYLKLSISG
jgi:hypothetical protein